MKEIALIFHLLGLVMGLGTSLAFMFLGIASTKLSTEEATRFQVHSLALSRMGTIGIVLLILSGLFLIQPYLDTIWTMPLLLVKLGLVLILCVFIYLLNRIGAQARAGDVELHLKRMAGMGRLSLLTALIILILAVLQFH
ncbi:MAG: hypothetical protein KDC57_01390 [Saprospiraceae bacterium]|nr:hypothetical protein [Saprospiraceae bacterium]